MPQKRLLFRQRRKDIVKISSGFRRLAELFEWLGPIGLAQRLA